MPRISLGQAVRNGIAAEQAAERFYRLLAESTDDSEARSFLDKMARQEQEHAALIADLGKRLDAKELPQRADDNVELIETAPEWAYTDNISFKEAAQLAFELETHAALFYDAIADSCEGPVKELFTELARLEERHAEIIRKMNL